MAIKKSAGLSIVRNDKLLLVHPARSYKWQNSCSIPKGHIEDYDEDKVAAARREVYEETGLDIPEDLIEVHDEMHVTYRRGITYGRRGKAYKRVYHYLVRVTDLDLKNLGLDPKHDTLPPEMLQHDEVDWAGFVDIDDAEDKLSYNMKEIANQIKSRL